MASRGFPGVLESVPLNTIHDAHPPLKKRKASHDEARNPAGSAIVIRAHATSLSDEPFVLDPITVLPRSRIPFSWLDTSFSTLSPIQSGSLFVADIPALEEHGLQERVVDPTVLVVRLMSYGGFYLVERVKSSIYALSRLGSWVGEGEVVVAGKGWTASIASSSDEQAAALYQPPTTTGNEAVGWWHAALIEDPVVDDGGIAAGKRSKDICVTFFDAKNAIQGNAFSVGTEGVPDNLAASVVGSRPQAMERNSSSDLHMPITSALDTQEQHDSMLDGDTGTANEFSNQVDDLQTPQELLDGLREQYLQALYISKTSLAYFAKGPLTRCRTAFQSTEAESTKKPMDLVSFYREAILPAKKMDIKYRETLPPTVRDAMLIVSDDETVQKKKRKSRKKKLGKDGLYPEEGDFIRRWWKDRGSLENGSIAEVSREAEMKKHVADLRLRETQLQILLILETMALESAVTSEAKTLAGGENVEKPTEESTKKTKGKKSQDLNVVLELHLDRLCIWHAVSFDDLAIPESIKDTENSHLSGKKAESDAVRDFCKEVIVPFYASRLPDKCKLITRKFGVSSSTTPKRPHVKKGPRDSNAKRQQQEEQQQQQQQAQQARRPRTLQRVLTDEQSSQGRHPSLKRHKTAPSKQDSTRDSMETLLPAGATNVRGGIQKAKRVENREVDLNAAARQHETKLRKVQILMDQKKELDAAIHTLRRPNRELVAKDFADDADKRTIPTGGGSARKQKNPVRNPMGQGVQVMATPKGSRKKDVTAGFQLASPSLPRGFPGPSVGHRMNAASSSPPGDADSQLVPNSAARPGLFSGPRMNTGDMGAIQETPTRRPAKSFDSFSKNTGRSNYPSGGLFRVPSQPSVQSTEMAAPSTPISSRRIRASIPGPTSNPFEQMQVKSSTISETPPRKQPGVIPDSTSSASALPPRPPQFPPGSPQLGVLSTPVKGSVAQDTPMKTVKGPGGALISADVLENPEKTIYEHLGWSDDDELGL